MSAGLSFVAPGEVVAAIERASTVELSAYTLDARGGVARALEIAGDRGAAVTVTLERFDRHAGSPGLRRAAEVTARELRAHGVRVRLGVADGDHVHLKAAVVDGMAFLDDRNWASGSETIVATAEPAHVRAVHDAIAGRTGTAGDLATEKGLALECEAAVIRSGGDRIDLASESFGASAVSAALRARANGGAHVRLLVNARIASERRSASERAVLRALVRAGVDIRTTNASEKLCVAGERGWVGSANATYEAQPMTDWGLTLGEPRLIDALEATFQRNWQAGRPLTV